MGYFYILKYSTKLRDFERIIRIELKRGRASIVLLIPGHESMAQELKEGLEYAGELYFPRNGYSFERIVRQKYNSPQSYTTTGTKQGEPPADEKAVA